MVAAGIMCQIYSMTGFLKEAFFRRLGVVGGHKFKQGNWEEKNKQTHSLFFCCIRFPPKDGV